MTDIVQRLKASLQQESMDQNLLSDALNEIAELREQRDKMEEILIILVRSGFPWDEDGTLNEKLPTFKERYANAMHEAASLLGLDLRSTITRTEPRT